jgi:hypothetical protein
MHHRVFDHGLIGIKSDYLIIVNDREMDLVFSRIEIAFSASDTALCQSLAGWLAVKARTGQKTILFLCDTRAVEIIAKAFCPLARVKTFEKLPALLRARVKICRKPSPEGYPRRFTVWLGWVGFADQSQEKLSAT